MLTVKDNTIRWIGHANNASIPLIIAWGKKLNVMSTIKNENKNKRYEICNTFASL